VWKLFKLCESSSGYIYSFRIYVGKDTLFQFPPGVPQPPTQYGPTERIVWFLMLPIMKKGHLYVENYYTSIPLFTALLMTRCRNMTICLHTKTNSQACEWHTHGRRHSWSQWYRTDTTIMTASPWSTDLPDQSDTYRTKRNDAKKSTINRD